MLRTLWQNGLRRWSGLVGSAGGRSAAVLAPACSAVVETLETRAMLHADDGISADHDGTIEAATLEAPAGVAIDRPVVSIVATDPDAHETDRDRGVFKVTRTGSTNKSLNVIFTIRGSAKNGVDYDKIASSVLLPAGTRSVNVVIKPIDDDRAEEPETVTLVLSENKSYAIDAEAARAKVGIRNNDGPLVNVTATDARADEAGNDRGVFRISRSGGTEDPLVVRYTVYGKATNGVDYEWVSEKLTIPAGASSETIAIKPVNDLHAETTSESVRIQLRIGKYLVGPQGKAALKLFDNDVAPVEGDAFITFLAPDGSGETGHVFHMPAKIGAIPTDVSRALDQIGRKAGAESGVGISPDGTWLVLHTNRFDTDGDDFDLAVYPVNNLGGGVLVAFDTGPVQPLGRSAIASGGELVVFESEEGPHDTDLWAAVRTAGSWSKVLLTADSAYDVNTSPSISDDGAKILFTGAGTDGMGQAILEVRTDATELRTVITQAEGPDGSPTDAPIGFADYAPNDTVVFQAGWDDMKIWKLYEPTSTLFMFSGATNESSPSVLSDGKIVLLWGGRPGNDDQLLELTIRYGDGSLLATLLPGVGLPQGGIAAAG